MPHRTTDALDRYTISLDANPRLAARLAGMPAPTGTADEGILSTVRSLLAFLGALPYPDRGIIVDWLFDGRRITDTLLRNYRISRRTARAKIEASGIEGLLLAIQDTKNAPTASGTSKGGAPPPG